MTDRSINLTGDDVRALTFRVEQKNIDEVK